MKRKNEETLIELAFGDLTPAEADRLRAEIARDADSQATLQAYEDLRASIGCLRDIPEMQMSRERLRHAILAGGLKESRKWQWNWIGAPVAIAAIAFAVTIVVRRPALPLPGGAGLTAMSADAPAGSSMDPNLERIDTPTAGMFGNERLNTVEFDPKPESNAKPTLVSSKPRSRVARKDREVREAPPVALGASAPMAASATMAAGAGGAGPSEMTLTSAPVQESSEVIVLTTETDRDTGAQRATAMESSSNVVIGG